MKVTGRADLAAWLDALAMRYTLIAPRLVESELLYRPVAGSDEIVFDFERTVLSPKTFFLPDTKVILEMEKRDNNATLAEPALDQQRVLFAVRPCDARGLRALDALLLDRPPPDTYYAQLRENTILIGLACSRLWDDCFCTSLGSRPDDDSAVDLMLHQVGDEFLVRVVTNQGTALLQGLSAEETNRTAPAPDLSGEKVPVLPPEAWGMFFDDVSWQRLATRRLRCHVCTYVCPTCRCFDIRAETAAAGPGYAHILRDVVPWMRLAGISDEQIHTMMVENPKRVLPFAPVKE